MTVARPALDGMGDFQDSKEALERQLAGLSIEQTDERCVLLLGLAELSVEVSHSKSFYLRRNEHFFLAHLTCPCAVLLPRLHDWSCRCAPRTPPLKQHTCSKCMSCV